MKNQIINNKLIAEFMGLTLYRGKWQKDTIATITTISKENELKYHKSWNWLMPVIEKIETLYDNGIDVDIFTDGTVITQYRKTEKSQLTKGKEIIRLTKAEIGFNKKIEHVYLSVVEFIKWL